MYEKHNESFHKAHVEKLLLTIGALEPQDGISSI